MGCFGYRTSSVAVFDRKCSTHPNPAHDKHICMSSAHWAAGSSDLPGCWVVDYRCGFLLQRQRLDVVTMLCDRPTSESPSTSNGPGPSLSIASLTATCSSCNNWSSDYFIVSPLFTAFTLYSPSQRSCSSSAKVHRVSFMSIPFVSH